MTTINVSVSIGREKYKTTVNNGRNELIADEPVEAGGTDLGFAPRELLLSSLGSCTAITIRMYADRKGWDLDEVEISLTMEQLSDTTQQTSHIQKHIKLLGNLDEEQRRRLLQVAGLCPVHKILNNPITIESNLVP